MKAPSPLLGFNNNVRHKGRLFHIQTEDSGIRHPHIITHLFADGGRILKTTKTSYAEHLGQASLAETVRCMMKEQHKAMFIALRDGQFDYLFEENAAPPPAAATPAAATPATATPAAATPAAAPPEPSKPARPKAPSSPEPSSAPSPAPAPAPAAARPAAPEPPPRPKAPASPAPPPRPAAPARPAAAPIGASPPPLPSRAAVEPAPAAPGARSRIEPDPAARRALGSARVANPLPGRAARPAPPEIKHEPAIDLDLDALERAAAEAQTPFFQQIQDLPPPPASVIGRRTEAAASGAGVYSNVHPEQSVTPAPAVQVEHFPGGSSSGRYAASRPASIFATNRPAEGASIFGEDLISEKSLDEVILSYLAEDLDSPSEKK